VAANHRPVAGRWIAQYLIGERLKILDGALDEQARRARRGGAGLSTAGAGGDRLAARSEQPLVARRIAVALKDVRHDAEIRVLAEAARAFGRHRRAHLREQVVRTACPPLRDELVALERGVRQRAQLGPMASRA